MVPVPTTYKNLPIFGTGATLVQPIPGTYSGGFLPGQLFPAEYENWLMNFITANSNTSQTSVVNLVAEMGTILAAASITPNGGQVNQVYAALNAIYAPLSLRTPIALTTGSPYSLLYFSTPVLEINATTNPYVVNLPAATGSGYAVTIINTSAISTGLIKIIPSTGEKIGPLAVNVACYLSNVDQSGWGFSKQAIKLIDTNTGQWTVSNGQFMPEPGSIDAAGSQYFLGPLRHLPLGNTSSRTIKGVTTFGTINTFGSAIQATGICGVPSGAKAIRARIYVSASTAVNTYSIAAISFSDNNSNAQNGIAGPQCVVSGSSSAGTNNIDTYQEVDIPLNSSGQFFPYFLTSNSNYVYGVTAVGYYMGC